MNFKRVCQNLNSFDTTSWPPSDFKECLLFTTFSFFWHSWNIWRSKSVRRATPSFSTTNIITTLDQVWAKKNKKVKRFVLRRWNAKTSTIFLRPKKRKCHTLSKIKDECLLFTATFPTWRLLERVQTQKEIAAALLERKRGCVWIILLSFRRPRHLSTWNYTIQTDQTRRSLFAIE